MKKVILKIFIKNTIKDIKTGLSLIFSSRNLKYVIKELKKNHFLKKARMDQNNGIPISKSINWKKYISQ